MPDYKNKPGTGSLWTNNRKNSSTHPDYTGTFYDLEGRECWLSMYQSDPDGNKPLFRIQVRVKDAREDAKFNAPKTPPPKKTVATSESPEGSNPEGDEVPF